MDRISFTYLNCVSTWVNEWLDYLLCLGFVWFVESLNHCKLFYLVAALVGENSSKCENNIKLKMHSISLIMQFMPTKTLIFIFHAN